MTQPEQPLLARCIGWDEGGDFLWAAIDSRGRASARFRSRGDAEAYVALVNPAPSPLLDAVNERRQDVAFIDRLATRMREDATLLERMRDSALATGAPAATARVEYILQVAHSQHGADSGYWWDVETFRTRDDALALLEKSQRTLPAAERAFIYRLLKRVTTDEEDA